jgi:dCMP deaminase
LIIGISGSDPAATAAAAAHLAGRGFVAVGDDALEPGAADAEPAAGRHYVVDANAAPRAYEALRARADFREIAAQGWARGAGPTPAAIAFAADEILRAVERPPWDDYFMRIAHVVASRSNCLKRHVAAVIVKDRRIISTGYNGTPRGTRNCDEGGCPRCARLAPSGTALEECVCSHAEENAITQAAYHGTCIRDTTLYTTFSPCLTCTKMIINSGIREVVYEAEYPLGRTALDLLREAGVAVRRHPET